MKIIVKLYAGLNEYLPKEAGKYSVSLDVSAEECPSTILEQRFQIPGEKLHLVLLNGVYLDPRQRRHTTLKEGDTLAAWPPVAGG